MLFLWIIGLFCFLGLGLFGIFFWRPSLFFRRKFALGGEETTKEHKDPTRSAVGTTAYGVCLLRALESCRSDREPLVRDPIAISLSSFFQSPLSFKVRLTFQALHFFQSVCYSRFFPWRWVPNFRSLHLVDLLAIRSKYLDEKIISLNKENKIKQFVIVGAGLDSRSHRFGRGDFDGHIFELDFPSMFEAKKKLFEKCGFKEQAHVSYVGTDLSLPGEEWTKELVASGFNPSAPSIWLMEGFTSYLEEQELFSLFRSIQPMCFPGSSFLITWIGEPKSKRDVMWNATIAMHKYRTSNTDLEVLKELGWKRIENMSIGQLSVKCLSEKRIILPSDCSYWISHHEMHRKGM